MAIFLAPIRECKPVLSGHSQSLMEKVYAKLNGRTAKIEIKQHKSARSNQQNRYLWGVVYEIMSTETGHTTEEIHDAMKEMFLPKKFIELNGQEVPVRKSTTELTTSEFVEYTERITALAGEMSISIPPPELYG